MGVRADTLAKRFEEMRLTLVQRGPGVTGEVILPGARGTRRP